MKALSPLFRSLAFRLGLYLLLFALAASIANTILSEYLRYEQLREAKRQELANIAEANLKSLGNSLWKMDDQSVAIQVDGLRQLPDVALVQVFAQDGTVLAASGADADENRMERMYPLEYEFRGERKPLGRLRVVLGLDASYREVRRESLSVMFAQMGRVLVLVGALLLVFYLLVVRHLRRLAVLAGSLTVNKLDQPLRLDRAEGPGPPDELGTLVAALEAMRRNMAASVEDLRAANEHLRDEVGLRQAAEAQVRATRALLQNSVDSMPSAILGLSGQLLVTHLNAAAVNLTGLTSAQALGRPLEEVLPSLGPHLHLVVGAVADRQPVARQRLRLDVWGDARVMDFGVFPLTLDASRGVVLRLDDATERVRMEEGLVQAEKMASLGGLAAGMAHEINNPLAGVLQNAQSLERRLRPGLPPNEDAAARVGLDLAVMERYLNMREVPGLLQGVRTAGERAARIVANMLSFARRSPQRHTPQDLSSLIANAVELAGSDWDLKKKYDFKHIRIVTEFDPALPPVPCSAQEIEQVLLNILKNAAQAMMEAPGPEEPLLTLRTRLEGDQAVIYLADNGPGMDEAVRRRIFDPFFTTKETGQGTGLGLSVSYFIVTQNHGGFIEVFSAPGRGSTFVLRLPLAPPEEGPPTA